MRSYCTKKVCVQCSMYNVLIENSEKNGLRFELIPQEIKSKECLEKDNLKWHKQSYSWYDTIILNEYPNPYYFSKIHVMLLLDDLLGVDIILIIDCDHSISSTNILLKYELGHNNQVFLDQATAMCKEILKSSLGSLAFERSMFFTKLNGNNLCRIYLKDLGIEEKVSTVVKIIEAFEDNEIFEKVTVKTRGRYSGYYEESLKGVSSETTYIQFEGANLKIYLPDIFKVLKNLRESFNQENSSEN